MLVVVDNGECEGCKIWWTRGVVEVVAAMMVVEVEAMVDDNDCGGC